MSWLVRSISDSLRPGPEFINRIHSFEDHEEEEEEEEEVNLANYRFDNVELVNTTDDDDEDRDGEGRGVKEDLSEFTQTLTRQFWGVASFLAPPPPPPPVRVTRSFPEENVKEGVVELRNFRQGIEEVDQEEEEESGNWRRGIEERLENGGQEKEELGSWRPGIQETFENGGQEKESWSWKRGIEKTFKNGEDEKESWSWRRGIEETLENGEEKEKLGSWRGGIEEMEGEEEGVLGSSFYKSDDFNVRDDEEVEDVIGVTEEALAFAHNIGHHPETWLDFPIEEEEEEDFQVSDSQYKHALAIQHLVPTLAALRIELCPVHMSEGYFWMVYFVLLHSRLNKVVADQLSSAELVQARSRWREELQKRAKPDTDWFGRSTSYLHENTNSPRDDFDPEVLENYEPGHISFNTYNDGYRPNHDPAYNESEKQIVECGEANPAKNPSGNSERDLLSFQSAQILQDQDDEDDWVQDTEELDGYSATGIGVNEEDVSFSDLEEDSDWTLPIKSK